MYVVFFNYTATTEIYALSLHDALPISGDLRVGGTIHAVFTSTWTGQGRVEVCDAPHHLLLTMEPGTDEDRKSTRLNSSHANISYAVFCLQQKNCRELSFLLPHYLTAQL